jgi:hypothetical protein
MPFPLFRAIQALGVSHMQWPEHLLQCVLGSWNSDDVDMVAHEAIGEDGHFVPCAVFAEPSQISNTVRIAEENNFAAVTALRHVVRDAGENSASVSGHAANIARELPAARPLYVLDRQL